MSGFVYFIKPVGQAGPIKVGHSIFPPDRLGALQTWSPVDLELISQFPGSFEIERAIHERFARWQVRGEWFEPVDELVKLAEGIRDGGNLEDLVDLSVKTGKLVSRPKTMSPKAKIVGSFKVRVDSARRYARGVRGCEIIVPSEVNKILDTAGGYRQEYRDLTQDEIDTLEAFIAECRSVKKSA